MLHRRGPAWILLPPRPAVGVLVPSCARVEKRFVANHSGFSCGGTRPTAQQQCSVHSKPIFGFPAFFVLPFTHARLRRAARRWLIACRACAASWSWTWKLSVSTWPRCNREAPLCGSARSATLFHLTWVVLVVSNPYTTLYGYRYYGRYWYQLRSTAVCCISD